MNLLKKLWNFLFGKKEEEATVEESMVEESSTEDSSVQHCNSHLRFRKNCPDCLRAVGII